MRSRRAGRTWIAGALVLAAATLVLPVRPAGGAGDYRLALPGYRYEFPRDHFNHPDFQTEWWYYTGNLRSANGRAFGFELTFFRQAVDRGKPCTSPWDVADVYLAHFAVSDLDRGRFLHEQRLNRAGPGLAGASSDQRRVWNGNWQVRWEGEGEEQRLRALTGDFAVRLALRPAKPPVIHGEGGVSQKAPGPGRASHYISFTRLLAAGSLEVEGERFEVEGLAWMDHEFFTHQLAPDQAGWDWFSVQLDDGTELMLYRLRRTDGATDPFSAGTHIDRAGRSRHLSAREFSLEPTGRTWRSDATGGVYPLEWRIAVPSLGLSLRSRTPLDSQEIVSRHHAVPSYWEGAIRVMGEGAHGPVAGVGYLEMTGYDRAVSLGR
ncbi:MAG TPA: lipocalin-like domain-containing protein [Vicinamibacterales bacterium]|nr:lipocalin-like domain-containing protein [Vicinamibacterales bacterium]